jgi:hypothetical protein
MSKRKIDGVLALPVSKRHRQDGGDVEIHIQRRLETELNGGHQVCPAGVADVVNKIQLIEIKRWKYWKSALGQLLAYGQHFPGLQKRAHFFGTIPVGQLGTIKETLSRYDILITAETPYDNEDKKELLDAHASPAASKTSTEKQDNLDKAKLQEFPRETKTTDTKKNATRKTQQPPTEDRKDKFRRLLSKDPVVQLGETSEAATDFVCSLRNNPSVLKDLVEKHLDDFNTCIEMQKNLIGTHIRSLLSRGRILTKQANYLKGKLVVELKARAEQGENKFDWIQKANNICAGTSRKKVLTERELMKFAFFAQWTDWLPEVLKVEEPSYRLFKENRESAWWVLTHQWNDIHHSWKGERANADVPKMPVFRLLKEPRLRDSRNRNP